MTIRSSKTGIYETILGVSRALKINANVNKGIMLANPVTFSRLEELHRGIVRYLPSLNEAIATPGIDAYARAQEGDETYNFVTEVTALRDASIAVRDHIETAIPKDGNGWLSVSQFDANHVVVERSFTVAQTATLRSLLDALIATVD